VLRAGDTVFVYRDSDRLRVVRGHIDDYARVSLSVFISGETGTGKEVVARSLHEKSQRTGRFVAINCAAFSKDLIAAELFGHARGAFSGATSNRDGLFRVADGGTLFLDEIGDMPLDLQPTLLRVLQEGVVRPVGSDQEVPVNVRVLSASHQDLNHLVQTGAFRADLYARLSQAKIHLPPLRERPDQILPLLEDLARESDVRCCPTPDAVEALLCWHWPMNVRELQSLVLRFAASRFGRDAALDLDFLYEHHVDMFATDEPLSQSTDEVRPNVTEGALAEALQDNSGNVMAAAKALGISRPKIYRLMKMWDLDPTRFRLP
jgi:DNA-binding NtrC family response regulator